MLQQENEELKRALGMRAGAAGAHGSGRPGMLPGTGRQASPFGSMPGMTQMVSTAFGVMLKHISLLMAVNTFCQATVGASSGISWTAFCV